MISTVVPLSPPLAEILISLYTNEQRRLYLYYHDNNLFDTLTARTHFKPSMINRYLKFQRNTYMAVINLFNYLVHDVEAVIANP